MKTAILFLLFLALLIALADMGKLPDAITRAVDQIPYGDKMGHFVLFGTLNFLAVRAARRSFPARSPFYVALSVSLALALLVAAEEYSQTYFAERTASWADLLSGYAGMALGAFAALKPRN